MKRTAISAVLAAVLFACSSMNTSAYSADVHPGKSRIFDFMFQMLENSSSAQMPLESRIKVAVAAAQLQAQALGIPVAGEELTAAAIRPQAYAPLSDTSFVSTGVSWQVTQEGTYTYTGGKVNTYLTRLWIGSWLNNDLTTWSYNGNGTIASIVFQTWDSDSNAFINSGRSLMSYDGSNRLSAMESQTWDGSTYIPALMILYTYDGSSRVATMISQEWQGSWVNVSRITYTYNGNGQETEQVNDNWFGSSWLTNTRWTSTYDGSNRLTLRVREFWNTMWNNDAKSEYEYSGSDNTLQRNSLWLSNAYTVTDVDTMKYDGSHRVIQTVHNQIVPFAQVSRTDNSYDGAGNLVEEIDAQFSGSWLNTERFVYVYTVLATRSEGTVLPGDFALQQNHPNPFNPTTAIRFNLGRNAHVHLEIRNVLGQLVRVLEDVDLAAGVYETTWDGRNSAGQEVASGVYFYTLRSGEFAQTRKMVLSR